MSYISDIADQVRKEVPREVIPEGDIELLFLMYAVLVVTVGDDVQQEHVHDTWAAWMTYQNPSHDSIKPYDQLDSEVRRMDMPFANAVKQVALRLQRQ